MKTDNTLNNTPRIVFGIYIVIVLSLLIRRIWFASLDPIEGMTGLNDDIMRLLSVRAWLDGQSWYDMTQYRVLAPEGIPIHWSRYVDLGIGSLIGFFALFVSEETAEGLALVFWPQLLLLALVVLTAWAANKIFGPWQAATSVLAIMIWPIIASGYFEPLRIDHHNVQILLMTVVIVSLILPTPSVRLGLAGGLASALSLAVGLENLALIALAGLILCVQVTMDPKKWGSQLAAFGVALGVGSLVLFIGQTHPDEWFLSQCDKLSPPVLGLTTMAALLSVVLVIGDKRLSSIKARSGLLIGCTVIGTLIVFPLLYPCLSGPYGNLSPQLQLYVLKGIGETKSAFRLISNGSMLFNWVVVPMIWILLIAAVVWIRRLRKPDVSATESRAVAILLMFGTLGFVGTMFQFRMIVLAAPAILLLAGYGLYAVFSARKISQAHSSAVLALIALVAFSIFYPKLLGLDSAEMNTENSEAGNADVDVENFEVTADCHGLEHISALKNLPKSAILARDRISTAILLATDHTILAVPYHRSPAALGNVFTPFYADEKEFWEELSQSGADYFVLCKNEIFGDGASFASQLAGGKQADGLEPMPLPEGSPLYVYRVIK